MDATPEPGPRIPAPSPRQWPRESFGIVDLMLPPEGSAVAERRSEGGPRAVNALATLAGYPALARGFLTFNRHLLYGARVTDRVRELVVLRVAWRWRCRYEWFQHAALGELAGLSTEEVERVAAGPDHPDWPPGDAALLRLVDELRDAGTISAATWRALDDGFDDHQKMDLVFIVGGYATLAMALNGFGTELDDGLEATSRLDPERG